MAFPVGITDTKNLVVGQNFVIGQICRSDCIIYYVLLKRKKNK